MEVGSADGSGANGTEAEEAIEAIEADEDCRNRRARNVERVEVIRVSAHRTGEEIAAGDAGSRAALLMARILALPDEDVSTVLQQVLRRFDKRHEQFEALLERHFALVAHLAGDVALSRERRLLIGAYFTNEYSVEGAALCNPSLVPAPDQAGMTAGQQRFVMSLRAIGEGHISSIEFRSGVIDAASAMTFEPLGGYLVTGDRAPPAQYDKPQFSAKLVELGAANDLAWAVLRRLAERFTLAELEHSASG